MSTLQIKHPAAGLRRAPVNARSIGKIVLYALLVFFAFLQLFPLLWVGSYSLQKTGDLFGSEFFTIPNPPLWENYVKAWVDGQILLYGWNSMVVVGISVLLSGVFSFCMAYAVSRMKWKLRSLVYAAVALGMVVPIHTTLLPNFMWFNLFGLVNTHVGLILPYIAFTISFNTIMFAAHMHSLPKEMEESAFMDGANHFQIIARIISPMTVPAWMTVLVSTFLNNWNEFIMANTYLASDHLRTLPFSIIRFQGQYSSDYAVQFACMTLVALPPLILFFFFSKWIMAGVTAGAVKG